MTSTHLPLNGGANTATPGDNKNHSSHSAAGATINLQQQIAQNLQHQRPEFHHGQPSAATTAGTGAGYSIAGHLLNGYGGGGGAANGCAVGPRQNGGEPKDSPIYEGLTMNRKIALNGGNEIRIGEKNISLHLNNPFASNYATTATTDTLNHQRNGSLINENGVRNGGGFKSSTESVYDRPVRRPHSIAVASPLNQRQNELAKEPVYAYGQSFGPQPYANSPQRTLPSRNSQEFSLYTPPSPLANQPTGIAPPVQQRRSQSVPRPLQSALASAAIPNATVKVNGMPASVATSSTLIQRPRSLDRCNGINPPDKGYKPPIPNRRLSQSGLAGVPPTPTSRPPPSTMRQSATFHGQGQLNRLAANFNYPSSENGNSDNGGRRKSDRPLSYAYGTLPDQVFLENQLRIYSEQLRNITESVRKYSEQAKLLSEMKRQQQQKQAAAATSAGFPNSVPIDRSDSSKGLYLSGTSDSNSSLSSLKTPGDDPQTPSHQLRLFLDNIRHTIKEPSLDDLIPEAAEVATFKPHSPQVAVDPVKTPSDQLRQFLDAIRSNQVPEETDIKGASDRFYKFKEKVEQSRPKSLKTHPTSDVFITSSPSSRTISTSESFSQISDNLRIMNQDLEALAQKSSLNHNNNNNKPGNSQAERQIQQFNRLLDDFQRMTGHQHAPETVDYFRKCSEGLRHVRPSASEQLSVSTSFGNGCNSGGGLDGMSESSSCSTTPGSIREAVQSLLMQPRNGVQIMDDRMRLFIEIVDSQDKFSQVRERFVCLF